MRRRTLAWITLGLLLATGCANFTDPAVRLAYCLKRAAGSLEQSEGDKLVEAYDFGLDGPCIVILHPEGELPDSAYDRAGLEKQIVAQLKSLRLGKREAIYVIALDGQATPSRTTSQGGAVAIPHLLVKSVANSTVTLTLQKSEQGVEVVSLE